jgi:hypothetical protein
MMGTSSILSILAILLTSFLPRYGFFNNSVAEAFTLSSPLVARSRKPAVVVEASKGMGMAKVDTKNKKKGAVDASKGIGMGMSKVDTKNKKKGNGNGASSSQSSPFDVKASLLRLEKKYDDLTLADARGLKKDDRDLDDIVTTEYIIVARSSASASSVPDWVPVAQLLVARTWDQMQSSASDGARDPAVQAAVSVYCREICHVASQGSRVFQSIPRNQLEYGVEPVEQFYKHVYDVLVKGKNDDASNDQVMTKKEARHFLGFDGEDIDLDRSDIKKRYRTKSFELHPDRFVGVETEDDKSQEEARDNALIEYARVKVAYETLTSGVRKSGSSFYESLGGRARTDFVGPIQLLPLQAAEQVMETRRCQSALVGLARSMVQDFVARGQSMVV